jgi:uncharacterized protein (TIGR00369 family)
MTDELRRLLQSCIESSSEEDLEALTYVLEGIQKKITGKTHFYLDGLLQMDRTLGDDFCEITMPLNPVLHNSLNILHGGITATLIDTAMGTLVNHKLPKGYGAVTNQLNIHYIAPGTGESIRCKAEIVHHGSKTMVVSGTAYRSDGKKIAHATGTFFIIQK